MMEIGRENMKVCKIRKNIYKICKYVKYVKIYVPRAVTQSCPQPDL